MTAVEEHSQDGDRECRTTTPPPFSINRLVALHSRERLLVHPLRWSDRQLSLLQCRFHSRGEGGRAESMPMEYLGGVRPSAQEARRCARRLARPVDWWTLIDLVLDLLESVSDTASMDNSRTVQLHFNRRPCATFGYCHIELYTAPPDLKYIEFACFDIYAPARQRREYFKPPPDRLYATDNMPMVGRSRILLRRHTPRNRRKDPYLVALIIALAQEQRRDATKQPFPLSSFTVRLLFLGEGIPIPLLLYVAHVQGSFLDMLDYPDREPSVNPGLDIHCWRIPAKPYDTLAQRLVRALRTDCCGEMHDAGEGNDAARALPQVPTT
ncbi:hypothetical protein VTI74DRAFT_11525 [Chaetomium olivicolor]